MGVPSTPKNGLGPLWRRHNAAGKLGMVMAGAGPVVGMALMFSETGKDTSDQLLGLILVIMIAIPAVGWTLIITSWLMNKQSFDARARVQRRASAGVAPQEAIETRVADDDSGRAISGTPLQAVEGLERLAKLREAGALSEDEFAAAKAEQLRNLSK